MKKLQFSLLALVAFSIGSFGQSDDDTPFDNLNYVQKGQFSAGMRTTTSLFGHDQVPGLGVGGQMRWQFLDYLNTEWFADWITLDLNGAGTRNNAHIGWSVMFYPKQSGRIIPYALAGHCFDYAKVTPLSTAYIDRSTESVTRWSSAIQGGLGTHFYLTDRFDISLSAQYMLHLGKHLDYELEETNSGYYLTTNVAGNAEERLEGHLLISASMNFRIADLW